MPKKLCWSTTICWEIKLEQVGRDKFIVTYGAEEHRGDYEYAARKLGACIMHALACEDRLDNRRPLRFARRRDGCART